MPLSPPAGRGGVSITAWTQPLMHLILAPRTARTEGRHRKRCFLDPEAPHCVQGRKNRRRGVRAQPPSLPLGGAAPPKYFLLHRFQKFPSAIHTYLRAVLRFLRNTGSHRRIAGRKFRPGNPIWVVWRAQRTPARTSRPPLSASLPAACCLPPALTSRGAAKPPLLRGPRRGGHSRRHTRCTLRR